MKRTFLSIDMAVIYSYENAVIPYTFEGFSKKAQT